MADMNDGGTASVSALMTIVEMSANDWGRDCSVPSGQATDSGDHDDFRYCITRRVGEGGRFALCVSDDSGMRS